MAKKQLREDVIYIRSTSKVKKWVTKTAKDMGISVSDYVHIMLMAKMNGETVEDSGIYADFR